MTDPDHGSLKKIQVQMMNRRRHGNEEIALQKTKNQGQGNREKTLQAKMKEKYG